MPDPIEAIKYLMKQQGLSQHDLIPFIGGRDRVYEVLGRKRPSDIENRVSISLTLNAHPQRRWEVLRLVTLADAHATPVRLGLVLGEHLLHFGSAIVVQHAQSEK
jgi:hypothetical protein